MATSETLDVIARRFACRAFQDTPIPTDLLHAVAEAGVRAPSAVNRQPWHLIVVTDKAVLSEIGRIGLENLKAADEAGYARILSRGGQLIYNAQAMVIVATDDQPGPFPVSMDAGVVASHLALAATSVGLNCCVAAMPGLAFAGDNGAQLKQQCIPAGYEFAICVLLGYAAKPGTPHEPDFSKITYI